MEVNVGMEWSLQFRAVKILTCNNSDSVNAALNEILACMQHNNDIHEDTDAADSDDDEACMEMTSLHTNSNC